LQNASSCSIGSATRRDCHDAGHDERAQRAEQRVNLRSRHAVLYKQRGGVSRHQRALWVVVALPFEHRRHDARQLVDKRRREHRVGERDDEQQLERLRLRGGALDNAPHELAALPRRGVTATRRPVETRTCEKRSSAWLSMSRCKIAAMRAHHDAPRQPSMCTSVDARPSARACALALPTARVHRVAEPFEVQRVGEPCDAARVNAVRDKAQRRRNLDAEVEPITAAEAEHTVLTQKRGQLLACRRALRRRPAARGPREPSKQLHGHDLRAALVV
jgi:hypothetical protein